MGTPAATAKGVEQMKDEEFLAHAYRGNADAVRLAMQLRDVSHLLDDLIDCDKEVRAQTVIEAFWDMLVRIPANRFYTEHASFLQPLMAAALMNWQIANVLERCGEEERNIAHSLRYDLASVFVAMAFICGGRRWAEAVGPEMRMRCQMLRRRVASHGTGRDSSRQVAISARLTAA